MSRYGISDPSALSDATRIARRAGMGYVMATVACGLADGSGHDMAAAQAFSLVFGYMFFGIALAATARRRMLTTSSSTGTGPRVLTIAMVFGGCLLLVGSASTLASLLAIVAGIAAG